MYYNQDNVILQDLTLCPSFFIGFHSIIAIVSLV